MGCYNARSNEQQNAGTHVQCRTLCCTPRGHHLLAPPCPLSPATPHPHKHLLVQFDARLSRRVIQFDDATLCKHPRHLVNISVWRETCNIHAGVFLNIHNRHNRLTGWRAGRMVEKQASSSTDTSVSTCVRLCWCSACVGCGRELCEDA